MHSQKSRFNENLISLHVTRLKTGLFLTYLTEGGVMTKLHSPAGLFFLSPVKIGAPPSEKVTFCTQSLLLQKLGREVIR